MISEIKIGQESASEIKIDPESAQEWSEYELQDVSLGDKRLDWRLRDTAAKLAARPLGSINRACDDWADTKAVYRLFDNKKTTPEKILSPHDERTRERVAAEAEPAAQARSDRNSASFENCVEGASTFEKTHAQSAYPCGIGSRGGPA